MSPVEKGKSSAWAPSKSYNAVAVPRPLLATGAGATGGGGIGLEAAGASGAGEEEEEKRALKSGRAAKYSSRRVKKASFSAESCSMAVKIPPPLTAVDRVRVRVTGGVTPTPTEEAFLIGGGGGLDAAGDETEEAAREGDAAAALAPLAARGLCWA